MTFHVRKSWLPLMEKPQCVIIAFSPNALGKSPPKIPTLHWASL